LLLSIPNGSLHYDNGYERFAISIQVLLLPASVDVPVCVPARLKAEKKPADRKLTLT